ANLVLVRRTNAARSRADLSLAATCFSEQVQVPMVRQDQVCFVTDHDPAFDIDSSSRELVHLREKRLRIYDNTIADDAGDPGMQDTGRNEAENELGSVCVHGVAGVVTTLITSNDREAGRQQVDDLALAFVAPLRTDHG